jgi:hypothetical protein
LDQLEKGTQLYVTALRSPNLNAFAERWARSVKQECFSRLILFGEGSAASSAITAAPHEYLDHAGESGDRPKIGARNMTILSSRRNAPALGHVITRSGT